jgi:hypothetical protein
VGGWRRHHGESYWTAKKLGKRSSRGKNVRLDG